MAAVLVLVAALAALAPHEVGGTQGERLKVGDQELSGPFTHDNLTVCLIHGPDRLKGTQFIMLAEALEKKKFVIFETQEVNTLRMENLGDVAVVILSGDILKGGQQDRIAQHDQIVPPKSGKLPLTVFCVERTASRWKQELKEEDRTFHASPGQLCSNELRLANRSNKDQSRVWKEVAMCQDKLSRNANVDVKAKASDSSLPLSLEAKEVMAAADKYTAKLAKLLDGKTDVVGYTFAINGKVVYMDVYGSPELFRKVWPRLIRANAIEAFMEMQKDRKFATPDAKAFQTFLQAAAAGKDTSKDDARGLRETKNEASRILRYDTTHPAMPAMKLRSNGIAY
jgi:hypothetical protein